MGLKWVLESSHIGIECPLNQMGFKWHDNWFKRTRSWMDLKSIVILMDFKWFGL